MIWAQLSLWTRVCLCTFLFSISCWKRLYGAITNNYVSCFLINRIKYKPLLQWSSMHLARKMFWSIPWSIEAMYLVVNRLIFSINETLNVFFSFDTWLIFLFIYKNFYIDLHVMKYTNIQKYINIYILDQFKQKVLSYIPDLEEPEANNMNKLTLPHATQP